MERRTLTARLKGPLSVAGALLFAACGATELQHALHAGVISFRTGHEVRRVLDPFRFWTYFWALSLGELVFAAAAVLGLLALFKVGQNRRLDRRIRRKLEDVQPYIEHIDR